MGKSSWTISRKSDILGLVIFGFIIIAVVHGVVLGPTNLELLEKEVSASESAILPKTVRNQPNVLEPAQNPLESAADDIMDEDRVSRLEKIATEIQLTGEKAESRTYTVKQMGAEIIRLVQLAVIVLAVMAVALPLGIWALARTGVVGTAGVAPEIMAALVEVEQRQSRLVNLLKEVQNEIDYSHSMSVSELKNLVAQAEKDILMNEKDVANIRRGSLNLEKSPKQ